MLYFLYDVFVEVFVEFFLVSLWQYASVESNGEHFMTPNDFIRRFLGLLPHQNYNEDTITLLANVVDTTKDGSVI